MTAASKVDTAEPSLTSVPSSSSSRFGWLRETAIVIGFYYVYQTIRSLADHGGVTNRAYGNARRQIGRASCRERVYSSV